MRSEANRYDTVRQVVHSQHRYEEYAADGVLSRAAVHRLELAYLYPADIRRVLVQTGFADITIAGDPMMIENCRWRVRTHPEPTYPNGGGLRRRPRAY